MSPKNKYLGSPSIYFLLFFFAAITYMLAGYAVQGTFNLLCEEMPELFSAASFISDPDGYERQKKVIALVTAFLAVSGVSYLSLILDNKRMEHIARVTEGRFTIPEGVGFYFKSFALSDLLSTVFPPLILSIPVYFIPEGWLDYGLRFPLYTSLELCGVYGFINGTLLLTVISILARAAVVPIALSRWRAAWLSGTAEVI